MINQEIEENMKRRIVEGGCLTWSLKGTTINVAGSCASNEGTYRLSGSIQYNMIHKSIARTA